VKHNKPIQPTPSCGAADGRRSANGGPKRNLSNLPPNEHKLVVAWIEIHQEDLLADWDLAVNGKTPFPIKGLDQ
jgi:hypothetical protein